MKKQLLLVALSALLVTSCGGEKKDDADPTSIKISTVVPDNFYVGDKITFEASLEPENARKNLTWSVSNKSAMKIDASTGEAEALQSGMVTVKVATDNDLKDTLSVIIKTYIPVTGVTTRVAEATIAGDGGFHYMDAKTLPEESSVTALTYTSSNKSVATVDENGMVTGHDAGSAVITATSVDNPNASASTTIYVKDKSWDGSQVKDIGGVLDFQDIHRSEGSDTIPTAKVDEVELLVVPYEFTDYPFTQKTLDDIQTLFNGEGPEETGYWESVSSYYTKSSYGKTKIHCTISDVYYSGDKAADTKGGASYSVSAVKTVYSWYKQQKGITGTEFDADNNGLVDAIYIVYSAKDYSKVPSLDNELFWAYVHRTGSSPKVGQPNANNYMWASYDFMYESGESKVDAHTFIHESGHLMGANDYYNYNKASSQSPLGGIDMMDHNIGSHNVYTKMAYGFITKPIYVNGNAKVTIKSAQDSATNNTIIIKDNWNGTPFDEMLVMELSTPTGLNKLDATVPYSSRPLVYDKPGIKMYHVDSRLYKKVSGGYKYMDKADYTRSFVNSHSVTLPAANSDFSERNGTPELFYEVGLIQAGGNPTMLKNGASGSNADLFHTGDYFRFEDYSRFFIDKNHPEGKDTFNDGSKFNYQIYFESVTADEATLVIQKVAL